MSVEYDPIDIEHSPTRVSGGLAVLAGFLAVVSTGLVSLLALLFGVLGLGLLAAGSLVTGSRAAVTLGTAGILLGLVTGGVLGTPTELLLIGMFGTVLAWDLGHNAIGLGRQLGRNTVTRTSELTHALASGVVGLVAMVLAYGVFLVTPGGTPVSALVFLTLGGLLLAWMIRS